ncbi:MAG: TatD family hydrolase [Bacteroidota bacterium]
METMVDTHAHIYLEAFDKDFNEMIDRAQNAGVFKVYMPNIDHTTIEAMLEVEDRNPMCIAMMGLHPCSVGKKFEKELYLVEEWLSKRPFTAVGEIGTDLYWDRTFWEQQQEAFKIQVEWAKKYNIPVVIHCRDSIDETIEMVEQLNDENLTGVFHCFTGNQEQAKRIVALGFYLGIGGVSTFKNGGLDKVLPDISLDNLLLETDSPYLAPTPHRGKRNEPYYLNLVATRLAELMDCPLDKVKLKTTSNSENLFSTVEAR